MFALRCETLKTKNRARRNKRNAASLKKQEKFTLIQERKNKVKTALANAEVELARFVEISAKLEAIKPVSFSPSVPLKKKKSVTSPGC